MLKAKYLVSILLFITLSAGLYSLSLAQSSSNEDLEKAPDFEVTTLEGNSVSLEKSVEENKPMVVYFTASWCPTCAKNWPVFSELYPEYRDDLNFISISIDPTDTKEVISNLVEEEDITYPSTWGHPNIMVDFGVQAQATTVGINRDGYIEFVKSNTALSKEEYQALFDQLVSAS
ncbi:TlpA family protein disulfide reductase [Rhodohalobacter sulfatireducens]|uniref:TlpA family protein disulfide reductase n=1 Tax=Rhodohalobacter sulfatireducens TaxID=2911366 RepID=A0ABS9KEK4_9BACT|nr:TlpA disulfide reductase family protein [Rhodohalobacter sulfatireducens]MCG2589253.1 TlpA family protein disulfide reductase [Rhodohalobacter sulfatireducens]